MWKFEDMMKYSKQLAKDIFSGKLTLEEAVIKDFEQTGISKDKARKILNELLSNSANRKPIKSGYSNNPDYFGDWYGKGQIDFNAIINPEYDGDIWMVKMWSGAGYVLDVYLCKATNVYDAIDIVFNWSYEHEGANNIVFDLNYLTNECREDFEKYPDYFGDDLSGDYEEFEMRWFDDYVANDSYDLFARDENFFVDKVPENVLAENQRPIENSRKPIKSMAAVSKNNRMDFKSLQNMAGMYLDREGIKFEESNDGLHVDDFGYIKIKSETSDMNRSQGRYSIELVPRAGDNDTYSLFENFENDYYEGTDMNEFQGDMEDIIRQIFAAGAYVSHDIIDEYGHLEGYPHFEVFNKGRYVDSSRNSVKSSREKRQIKSSGSEEWFGIEMIFDELKDYFRDYGFNNVEFYSVGKTNARVDFNGWYEKDIDEFYKSITSISHNFSNNVVPIWFTMETVSGGDMKLTVNVEPPM